MPDDILELEDLPKGTISNSSDGQFARCNHQWHLRHVEGLRERSNSAMVLGNAFHEGQAWADGEQMSGKPRPPTLEIQGRAKRAVGEKLKSAEEYSGPIEWKEGDTLEVLEDHVFKITGTYEAFQAEQGMNVIATEWPFRIKFKNTEWQLTGRGDKVLKIGDKQYIVDTKTSKKKKTEMEVHVSPQLTTYSIAWLNKSTCLLSDGELIQTRIDGVFLDVIVRPTKDHPDGNVQRLPAKARTNEERADRLDTLDARTKLMRSGMHPKTDAWLTCSWCGYLKTCKPDWWKLKQAIDEEKKKAKAIAAAEKAEKKKPAAAKGKK